MKLLFVLPAYEPAWAMGGVVRCTSTVCRALAAQGHQVDVYTIDTDGAGVRLGVPAGVPVDRGDVAVRYYRSTLGPHSVWDSRALARALRRQIGGYDLVYAAAVWQWLGWEAARAAQRGGVPLVIGTHGALDAVPLRRHGLRKRLYWRLALQGSLARAAALHYTTGYERAQSAAAAPSFVVPNGLNAGAFRRSPRDAGSVRSRYGIPRHAPLVLVVGRLDPIKRVDLLIEALAQAEDVHLGIVGPDRGRLAEQYRALSRRLGVAQRVAWIGVQTGDALVRVLSAGDAIASLSAHENFAMSVVEGMACGLPALVSEDVGVWHEVKDADVGTSVGADPAAVAAALRSLAAEPELWRKRGRRAATVARERFAVDRVAGLMGRAFEDVISGERSPACRWQEPEAQWAGADR